MLTWWRRTPEWTWVALLVGASAVARLPFVDLPLSATLAAATAAVFLVDGTSVGTWGIDATLARPVLDREYQLRYVAGDWHVYQVRR